MTDPLPGIDEDVIADDNEIAWLRLLRDARRDMGGMTYYAIAARGRLSYGTVAATFTGRNTPSRRTLEKLAGALTRGPGDPTYEEILEAHHAATYVPEMRGGSPMSPGGYISANKALQAAFESGLTEVADAIRDVAAAIRETRK